MDLETYFLKYRPKNLKELDLPDVSQLLEKTLTAKTIPHAFLFSGYKGTGKTSAARILAKTVNCLKPQKDGGPCSACDSCQEIAKGNSLDLIEIDAASNRGIDDIRELKDKIKLSPVKSKYKVYIIDEVHMLTAEAFNALLKTLEEPPSHAIFVLCTTAPEKLPETIVSRCTRINFRRARKEELVKSLERVVKGESLKVEEGVLAAIALAAGGSFRDGHKILEQLGLGEKKITLKAAKEFLEQTEELSAEKLLLLLYQRDLKTALALVGKAGEGGADFGSYTLRILETLRLMLLTKIGLTQVVAPEELKAVEIEEIKTLISLFTRAAGEIRWSPITQLPLEMAVVEFCLSGPAKIPPLPGPKPIPKIVEKNDQVASSPAHLGAIEDKWPEVLVGVRPLNHSVEALLKACRPLKVDGQTLTLEVFYKFHKERLETEKCRSIVEEVVSRVAGSPLRVVCILGQKKPESAKPPEEKPAKADIYDLANDIFNGKIN